MNKINYTIAAAAITAALTAGTVNAGTEARVGAALRGEFGASGTKVYVVGLGQVADVEENEVTMQRQGTRTYLDNKLKSDDVKNVVVSSKKGGRTIGAEIAAGIQVYGEGNDSFVEVSGFAGDENIQGALGAGIQTGAEVYAVGGVNLPYAKVGTKYNFSTKEWSGIVEGRTFGGFNVDTNLQQLDDAIKTVSTYTPKEPTTSPVVGDNTDATPEEYNPTPTPTPGPGEDDPVVPEPPVTIDP